MIYGWLYRGPSLSSNGNFDTEAILYIGWDLIWDPDVFFLLFSKWEGNSHHLWGNCGCQEKLMKTIQIRVHQRETRKFPWGKCFPHSLTQLQSRGSDGKRESFICLIIFNENMTGNINLRCLLFNYYYHYHYQNMTWEGCSRCCWLLYEWRN